MVPRNQDAALSIRALYKVFADDDRHGLQMAIEGCSKDEVQEETGAVVGLRDINIEIGRGELFVIMGLSGCGKSTLVRCINRLIEPSLGEVWLGGREVTAMGEGELRELRRRELAMVFQHFGLMPHRNVLDNVAFPLEVGGVERRERRLRAYEALALVGLSDWGGARPSQLSGGMKQRVGLARALALDSPVLLMDEPFSALDPVIRRDLQDELIELQARVQKTIVFITHDLNEAVRVGDRIAIMRDGEVVQEGSPNDVVLNPRDDFVREFTQDVRLHGMITAGSIMDTSAEALAGAMSSEAVRADTVLDDLVPAGLRAQHPLRVVDAGGQIVGVIPLARLAQAMASDEAAAAAVAEGS